MDTYPLMLMNMMIYGELLKRCGVKNIGIYNLPLEELRT